MVTFSNTPIASASWNAILPITLLGTLPVIAITGELSQYAVISPVVKLVVPGPDVAVHTPGTPEALAYPSAACAAACSCLIRTCLSSPFAKSSTKASYICIFDNPGIPNTTLTPSLFRESTKMRAPVGNLYHLLIYRTLVSNPIFISFIKKPVKSFETCIKFGGRTHLSSFSRLCFYVCMFLNFFIIFI
uniref:Uncharacterized protein ORF-c21_020 n=1 Tax=Saccharolobus solfataricus TaxID=2287 RepID=Q9UWY2_SACSO|nr:hypothetical protein [Saccharolobus solfataricus P2]